MIILFLTFEQTNVHCLKFSQKQTILSSNEINSFISKHKSKIIRLTTNISNLRCMKNLFQNINFVRRINSINFVFFEILQKLFSSKFNEILNWKWTIWFLFNKVVAMSNDATTKTIKFSKRNLFNTMFWTKILLVSLKSFKK